MYTLSSLWDPRNVVDCLKWFWKNKCVERQWYIDNALMLFIVIGIIAIILLLGLIYYNLPELSVITFLKAPRLWISLVFLTAAVVTAAYLTRKPVLPPEDGKLYIALSNLGCEKEKEGEILRQAIKKELSRYVGEISPSLQLMNSIIQQTVRDKVTAEKYGRQRGVHFVIYGQLRGGEQSGRVEYVGGEVQVYPFQGSPSLGNYSLTKSFDAYDQKQVEIFSRDIVVKLLKLYHANIGELRNNQVSFNRAISPGAPAFNIGSNLMRRFQIGRDRPGEPFLIGHTRSDGRLLVSGRLFDSDGAHAIEIQENKVKEPYSKNIFDVGYSGGSFFIYDSYERLLLQVKQEEDLGSFVDAYLRDLKEIENKFKERIAPVPEKHTREWEKERRELMALNSMTTVTGEIYSASGIPLVFIEKNRLLQYTTIPIDLDGFSVN